MFNKLLYWIRNGNDCGKCPYYFSKEDYWGECDEYCTITSGYIHNICRKPLIIRWILSLKRAIQDTYSEYRFLKDYEKENKECEQGDKKK
jgi:hypothetical protein